MFGQKPKDATVLQGPPADGDSRRAGRGSLTILGQGCVVNGSILTDGDLQIDGLVTGDVDCASITIGAGGEVRGDITAETLLVRGATTGGVSARLVHLASTARVEGDIVHVQLVIEAGAQFEGRSRRKLDTPEAANAAPAGAPAPLAAIG